MLKNEIDRLYCDYSEDDLKKSTVKQMYKLWRSSNVRDYTIERKFQKY